MARIMTILALHRTARRRLGVLGVGVCLVTAGGCVRESTWDWQGSQATAPQSPAAAVPYAGTEDSNASVMVFPHSDFRADDRIADARRDATLGARADADVLPNRLAWPREARPDLRYTDSFRTSRNANRFVFPRSTTGRRDGGWYWGSGYTRVSPWGVRSGYRYGYGVPPPDAYPPYQRW